MLAGLSPDTVLGRVVAIRSETDTDVIKHFSEDQKRIYNAWRTHRAETMKPQTYENEMQNLEQMFAQLFG